MGRDLAYINEIVEFNPPNKLVMRTADGPFPMETTCTFESIGNTETKMTIRNKGLPSGFSKIFAPIMSFMMRRANTKDLRKIKMIIESKQ